MSLWFSASAVSDEFRRVWSLSASQAGWLTTVVQLGFVAGTATAAFLNLADVIPARRYFAASALCGAIVNAALVVAPGYGAALVLRFATGFFLAGVYPPGMKMAATWFQRGRGLAIGTVVGALTVGKAAPYLMKAWVPGGIAFVVLSVSAGAMLASALVLIGYRDGPYPFTRRPFSWHWIPVFLAASVAARGRAVPISQLSVAAFVVIAVGGVGCLWGGWLADRIGYDRLVIRAMAVSGACSILAGAVFGRTLWILLPLALVWGFFVVADSAQFSAMVTEVVPQHAVGTALTLQTSLGFLLTMLTIQMVPAVAEAGSWRWELVGVGVGEPSPGT